MSEGGPAGDGRASDARPDADDGAPTRTVEVDGLVVTSLPGGGLALVDSHPDGVTSFVTLDGVRLEALLSLLAVTGVGEGRTGRRVEHEAPSADPTARLAGDAPGRNGTPRDASGSDWDVYDQDLKAAFLLGQYAGGVAPDDLPPGWRDVLEQLPAVLAARSRHTRARIQGGDAAGG